MKNDIRLITLAGYNRPELTEDLGNNWVMNGRANAYYQYIIDRNNGSPTNSSINQSYSTLIYGKGLSSTNGHRGAQDWGRLQTVLRPRDLRRIVQDYQVFGEFSQTIVQDYSTLRWKRRLVTQL